ncbi:MAG: hypothetical protein HZA89_04095 [Verrucomicrobia bacterium]|nr:hypothetical protein [Verrucomicrobiota bacterium]
MPLLTELWKIARRESTKMPRRSRWIGAQAKTKSGWTETYVQNIVASMKMDRLQNQLPNIFWRKYMKGLLLILCFATVSTLKAEPFITIGDLKLFRAYAPTNSKVELREYIPQGENIKEWSRLASVRVFKNLKDPEAYLRNVAATVAKSHPSARYQYLRMESDKTKKLILDFMTFPPESVPKFYAEWNLMRAQYVAGKGLVVYQYAMRTFVVGKETGTIVNAERKKMTVPFYAATFEESEESK